MNLDEFSALNECKARHWTATRTPEAFRLLAPSGTVFRSQMCFFAAQIDSPKGVWFASAANSISRHCFGPL